MESLELLFATFSPQKKENNQNFINELNQVKGELVYLVELFDQEFDEVIKAFLVKNPQIKVMILEKDPIGVDRDLFFKRLQALREFPNVILKVIPQTFHWQSISRFLLPKVNYDYQWIFSYQLDQKALKFWRRFFLELEKKKYEQERYIAEKLSQERLFEHFFCHWQNISHLFFLHEKKGYFQNIPAIICGAGPSLKKEIEHLKKLQNKALIFACGTAISIFSQQQLNPHFLVASCPRDSEYQCLSKNTFFHTPTIFTTRLNANCNALIHGMNGLVLNPLSDLDQLFMQKIQLVDEESVNLNLSNTVAGLALQEAIKLGCNPIILCGVDLAYEQGKKYFDFTASGSKEKLVRKKNADHQVVYSTHEWIEQGKAIEAIQAQLKEKMIISTSKGGLLIKNISYMTLDEIEKQFLLQERDLVGLVEAISKPKQSDHEVSEFKQYFTQLKESFVNVEHLLKALHQKIEDQLKLSDFRILDLMESLENEEAYLKFLKPIAQFLTTLEEMDPFTREEEDRQLKNFTNQLKFISDIVPRYRKILNEPPLC